MLSDLEKIDIKLSYVDFALKCLQIMTEMVYKISSEKKLSQNQLNSNGSKKILYLNIISDHLRPIIEILLLCTWGLFSVIPTTLAVSSYIVGSIILLSVLNIGFWLIPLALAAGASFFLLGVAGFYLNKMSLNLVENLLRAIDKKIIKKYFDLMYSIIDDNPELFENGSTKNTTRNQNKSYFFNSPDLEKNNKTQCDEIEYCVTKSYRSG